LIERDARESAKDWPAWILPKQLIERAWLGSDLFADLMNERDDFIVRTYAAHVLGMLLTVGPRAAPAGPPDRYPSVIAALIARLHGEETDPLASSSVVFALGRASVHDLSLIDHLRRARSKPNAGEATRVAAALAVMEIDGGKHANLDEVDLLIDTMCRAAETDTLYQRGAGSSPWVGGRLRFRLSERLCAWSAGDRARMERVFPALLTSVSLTSAYAASVDLYHVFRWLWPDRRAKLVWPADGKREYVGPPPIASKDLDEMAHRVIRACYEKSSIWELPVGNTAMTFREVGLPETRAGLKVLLDGIPS